MAEAFLSLNARDRRDILETVAARSGRSAGILEKDIWICWVLQTLFSIPHSHPMAFKGGTSLSKVYGIIDRFSEDIDITLDYRAFGDAFDPFAPGVSRTQIERFSDRLRSRVAAYSRDVVAPALEAAAEGLATSGRHGVQISDDGESVWFAYPSTVENTVGYLKSEVLLEFGGRNVIDPNERHEVAPDIAALTNDLEYPAPTVTVLSPARTFWEKATLRCSQCLPPVAGRQRLERQLNHARQGHSPAPPSNAAWSPAPRQARRYPRERGPAEQFRAPPGSRPGQARPRPG